jgi:hypothetical protein
MITRNLLVLVLFVSIIIPRSPQAQKALNECNKQCQAKGANDNFYNRFDMADCVFNCMGQRGFSQDDWVGH